MTFSPYVKLCILLENILHGKLHLRYPKDMFTLTTKWQLDLKWSEVKYINNTK